MKKLSIVIAMLIVAVASYQCTEKPKTEEIGLPQEVVASIEKRIQNGQTPSMALAVIDSSGVKYYNFGKTTLDGKPVDENTIYEIGSISKVFTAILLAQQVLDGDVKLEDEINDYLPDSVKVPVMGDTPITFGNLTDHTSGIPRMPTNFAPANPNNPYADYTVQQMYEFISGYEPSRPVGSEYEYSNLAQGLLGHLLAMNKDTTYEALMVATIAGPLGMNDTKIAFTERMKQNLALGHSGPTVVENWDIPTLAGAGAIRSSTSDMAKFISANLGYVDTPLRAAMDMSHKMRHSKAGSMQVGMGWHIKNGKEGDVIWHNGGTGGYRTFAGFVKETGKGVVLLTNSSTGADDIGFNLLDSGSELAVLQFKSDAVEVAEPVLERYVGVYELQPEFLITITNEGGQLYGQATGQERFEIYAENDTVFFQPEVKAKISFQIVDNGVVESLTLFQGGGGGVARKIE
jgi:serine-type D-Ala-D-Ala carboxypeptidase/endopeptidase